MREGWSYKKLGEVCEVLNGFAFKSEKYQDQGFRILRITNVQKGTVVDDDPKYYPFAEFESPKMKQYVLRENDLLVSLTGNVGRVGILDITLLPAALNQRVACLRLKEDSLSLKFLFHILNSDSFEQDCILSATGIAQKNMSTEWLKQYVLPIPPLTTQQQIVSELDLLSHILDQKRQQLKEYDALAESIFYDMFGDPVENPKGWEKKKLGDICSQIKDGVHAKPQYVDFGVPFVSVININKGVLNLSDCKYVSQEAYAKMSKSFKAEKGDILYSKVGATYGIPALVDTDQEFGLYVSVSLLKPKREIVLPLFLKISMGLRYIKDQADKGIKGIGVPDLHLSVIKEFQVLLPPLTLQRSFAAKIESIEHQKQLLRASIKETEMLFQSRMDYWFNG